MKQRSLPVLILAVVSCPLILPVGACGFPSLPRLDGTEPGADAGPGGPGADGGVVPDNGEVALVLLAGHIGSEGNLDGQGTAARFMIPGAMCIDPFGNTFVAEPSRHIIRKISASGTVSLWAGAPGTSGISDGPGPMARFSSPSGLACENTGSVYVADAGNRTIRKISLQGVVTTYAGLAGQSGDTDGPGATARFRSPQGLAIDGARTLYVADPVSHTVRQILLGGIVGTVAGSPGMTGANDGVGSSARFSLPMGVAVSAGVLYVTDSANHTIRRIDLSNGMVTTLAGTAGLMGSVDGAGNAATFSRPGPISVDGSGGLYVVDTQSWKVRSVASTGDVATMLWGPGVVLDAPSGVVASGTGELYLSIRGGIVKGRSGRIDGVFAGLPASTGYVEGIEGAARFYGPAGIATAGAGSLYVADTENEVIRKITLSGSTSLWAGIPGVGGTVDGPRSEARFAAVQDLVIDSAGVLYAADYCAIRKLDLAGNVTTFVGLVTTCATVDGTGTAARLYRVNGMAIDRSGNLFVSQGDHVIRKITPQGEVSTLAGSPGMSGTNNGTGAAARFYDPKGMAIDPGGNLYVADHSNNAIRKVSSTGTVTTYAGVAGSSGRGSTDGLPHLARFSSPSDVAIDDAGNLYVADTGNATIRKIAPGGSTSTIAGRVGVLGVVLGTAPTFYGPRTLHVMGDSLIITDANAVLQLRHIVR